MLDIKHVSYRVKSKGRIDVNSFGGLEWALLNVVFQIKDEEDPNFSMKSLFMQDTQDWKKGSIITDIEEYKKRIYDDDWFGRQLEQDNAPKFIDIPDTSDITVEGWRHHNARLRYIEKFDVFAYLEYISWSPATQGLVQELRLLQQGVNFHRTISEQVLYNTLKSLQYFWD